MRVLYLTDKGKHTEDASKAIYGAIGETRELKAPRFKVSHDGHDLIWEERECGLPKVSTKQKRGDNAEKPTSNSTRSAKSASKKG